MSQTQVLARKWRPRTFSELTGQDHVVKALTHALEQQRLHHAYLFTGTRGVGKTTIARILAKALNCETGITAQPCGVCSACTQIDEGCFVDLVELDAASNTQVDSMRELLENALYAPTCARYKIYIIDEVHMLSKSAFNAMLKTLEEPPAHVKFVLATTDPQKIPITVLSRCLQFNLKQIVPAQITACLTRILQEENIEFDTISLQLLARVAQGSMRDALSMLDQAIAFGQGRVGEAAVRDMLGVVDQRYLFDLLDALAQRDGARMLAIADEMEARCLSFDAALQDLSALLHQITLAQTVPAAIDDEIAEHERIHSLTKMFSPEDIQLFYQITLHGRSDLSLAPDEYAGFTMTLMRMLVFIPQDDATAQSAGVPRPVANPRPSHSRITKPENTTQQHKTPPADTKPVANQADLAWPELVKQLKLTGMAKMLAQHSEAASMTADRIELCVPTQHKHLLDRAYQDKIKAALEELRGTPVTLAFSVGEVTGMTPAAIQQQDDDARQAKAVAAIKNDPVVQELVDKFDAKVIDSSIKPI